MYKNVVLRVVVFRIQSFFESVETSGCCVLHYQARKAGINSAKGRFIEFRQCEIREATSPVVNMYWWRLTFLIE